MIIVKLMGGLGNQMFQYAAARSLSLSLGTELKLDLSFLEGDQLGNTRRTFELNRLNIDAGMASPLDVSRISGPTARRAFFTRFFKKSLRSRVFREKQFHVDPDFFLLSDDVYLDGYWQSERYFERFSDTIRNDFVLRGQLAGVNLELAREIGSFHAVSIHVRRGDYVSDEHTRVMHHVCGLEYYCNAVKMITPLVDDPHFFVFSDDPEWAEANLKLGYPTRFISHNQNVAHEDLYLMSLCRHNIIANSSFSWWGAWLNSNPDKIVCAPSRWFNKYEADTCDLIPHSWRKIS